MHDKTVKAEVSPFYTTSKPQTCIRRRRREHRVTALYKEKNVETLLKTSQTKLHSPSASELAYPHAISDVLTYIPILTCHSTGTLAEAKQDIMP